MFLLIGSQNTYAKIDFIFRFSLTVLMVDLKICQLKLLRLKFSLKSNYDQAIITQIKKYIW